MSRSAAKRQLRTILLISFVSATVLYRSSRLCQDYRQPIDLDLIDAARSAKYVRTEIVTGRTFSDEDSSGRISKPENEIQTAKTETTVFDEDPKATARKPEIGTKPVRTTAASNEASENSKPKKTYKLFHVINTFAINKDNKDDSIHQNYEQWSALQSIQRAKNQIPQGLEAATVCAMFQSDWEILWEEIESVCDRRFLLERSTITEYGRSKSDYENSTIAQSKQDLLPSIFSKQELPFIQDLLDAAVSVARENSSSTEIVAQDDDDFYIMLTNSDIGMTKGFFRTLKKKLKKGQKIFSMNRMTIPIENSRVTVLEPTTKRKDIKQLLAEIDASIHNGEMHIGYDCFVIHSSFIDKVNLGRMFAGFPPWGGVLNYILTEYVAKGSYINYKTNKKSTFHLGGEGTWMIRKTGPDKKAIALIKEQREEDFRNCPFPSWSEDPHTYMNTANCGPVIRNYKHKN